MIGGETFWSKHRTHNVPRIARKVFAGLPHHVTQRGARRLNVFFEESDRRFYLDCLREYCEKLNVVVLAYCLMTNHVHHILVPPKEDSLHKLLKSLHTRYANLINKREGWSGHLWQARYFSSPLDEASLLTTIRYVELNPVRAKIVRHPEEYQWGSARSRIRNLPDPVLNANSEWSSVLPASNNWRKFLSVEEDESTIAYLRRSRDLNLPFGEESFVQRLERICQVNLRCRGRGRPKKR